MKILNIFFLLLIINYIPYAQIGFHDHIVIDDTQLIVEPFGVYSSDIDSDGDMDIIVASRGNNKITWFENTDGNGNFEKEHIISTNCEGANNVFSIDIDGDGDMDVLAVSGYKVSWFENIDGQGKFIEEKIIFIENTSNPSAYPADLDGDGDIDIISSSWHNKTIFWFENIDGSGNFGARKNITIDQDVVYKTYGTDIDNDGDIDVISASRHSHKISLFVNLDGKGNFGDEIIITTKSAYPNSIYSQDLDGDGDMDILSASSIDHKIAWYENIDGYGQFSDELIISLTSNGAGDVYAEDIDGDGDMDVLSASLWISQIAWYENKDGEGDFSNAKIITNNAKGARSVFACDLDMDNDIDVISASYLDDKIIWYKNLNGKGEYDGGNLVSNNKKRANGLNGIYGTDFDRDGDIDIAFTSNYKNGNNSSENKLAIYSNIDGKGNFGIQENIVIDKIEDKTIYFDDIDNDGDVDILFTRNYNIYNVKWYENLNNVDTFSLEKDLIKLSENTMEVKLCDLDGDGDSDVVYYSDTDEIFRWIENLNGSNEFSEEKVIENIPNGIHKFECFDLNQDGYKDLICSSKQENLISWYKNEDGKGNFSNQKLIGESEFLLRNIKMTDLDGDNDIDIITSTNSKIYWYENSDGAETFFHPQIINTNSYDEETLYLTDINSDGDLDIVTYVEGENKISIIENIDNKGNFKEEEYIFDNSNHFISLKFADIDGDGDSDAMTISYEDNKIIWHENLGILENTILGKLELNYNDSIKFSIPNVKVVTDNNINSFSTFSNTTGNFLINANEGDFITSIESGLPDYYKSTPESYTSHFIGTGIIDTIIFNLTTTKSVHDLQISIIPKNDARPGFYGKYQLIYKNIGTSITSGEISFTLNSLLSEFIEASDSLIFLSNNTIKFEYKDLKPFEYRTIDLSLRNFAPPILNNDDILQFTAKIDPIIIDEMPDDNVFTLKQKVIGSFDPNDIIILEGDNLLLENIENYLHYIIRFQNTGTANAIKIRVNNTLDKNLDWNTLEIINLSHDCQIEIEDHNKIDFIFNAIYLPDSTTDEKNSHGFIAYKIKPKNDIMVGEIIENEADIFFDFNLPISTNTVYTKITEPNFIDDYKINPTAFIFPNPTKGKSTIISNKTVAKIEIYNSLGQSVCNFNNSNVFVIPLSIHGLLFCKITYIDKSNEIKKILKMK